MGLFTDVGGIPVVSQSSGEDKGMGQGGMWIFALIVLVFIALFGLNGFNRREGGTHGVAEIAALNTMNHDRGSSINTAAFTELNGRMDALSQQISHINDVNDLRDLKSTQAALNQNVTQQAFNLSTQIATNRTDTLLNFKDLALQNANCCCDTNRNIDNTRFESAQNTSKILESNNANTQRIMDRLCQDEITRLRDDLSRERLMSSQLQQNAYLVGALKPYPQPAYNVLPPVPTVGGYVPEGAFI